MGLFMLVFLETLDAQVHYDYQESAFYNVLRSRVNSSWFGKRHWNCNYSINQTDTGGKKISEALSSNSTLRFNRKKQRWHWLPWLVMTAIHIALLACVKSWILGHDSAWTKNNDAGICLECSRNSTRAEVLAHERHGMSLTEGSLCNHYICTCSSKTIFPRKVLSFW